jgi:hypothetical protein
MRKREEWEQKDEWEFSKCAELSDELWDLTFWEGREMF